MKLAVGLLAALVLALAGAAPAFAVPLLDEADATDLAETLADAQAVQGVCYGWAVSGDAESVGSSNNGADQPVSADPATCPKGVVQFVAFIAYASEFSEAEDSVSVQIESNLAKPPTVEEIEQLGISRDELLGNQDDLALIEMVGALPLIVAEHGEAPYVPFEPAPADASAASDRPTNSPGSDLLRSIGPILGLGAFFVLCGVGYFFLKRAQLRAGRSFTAT